jgi:hypothetical protein
MGTNSIRNRCDDLVVANEMRVKVALEKLALSCFLNFIVMVVYPFVIKNPNFKSGVMVFFADTDDRENSSYCGGLIADSLVVDGAQKHLISFKDCSELMNDPTKVVENFLPSEDDDDFINAHSRPFINLAFQSNDEVRVIISPKDVKDLIDFLFNGVGMSLQGIAFQKIKEFQDLYVHGLD